MFEASIFHILDPVGTVTVFLIYIRYNMLLNMLITYLYVIFIFYIIFKT